MTRWLLRKTSVLVHTSQQVFSAVNIILTGGLFHFTGQPTTANKLPERVLSTCDTHSLLITTVV